MHWGWLLYSVLSTQIWPAARTRQIIPQGQGGLKPGPVSAAAAQRLSDPILPALPAQPGESAQNPGGLGKDSRPEFSFMYVI